MNSQLSKLQACRAAISELARVQALNADDRAEIFEAIGILTRICTRHDGEQSSFAAVAMEAHHTEAPQNQKYIRLSAAEAVVEYLKTVKSKKEQPMTDIVSALQDGGFEFDSDKPTSSTSSALERRAHNFGDVVKVRRGVWGLTEWYSERQLDAFRHKERTRAGMNAAKARGKQVGAVLRLSKEQATRFKLRWLEGAKIRELGEEFELSQGGVQTYKKRLKNWNPGDPYPPSAVDDEEVEGIETTEPQPTMRVVK